MSDNTKAIQQEVELNRYSKRLTLDPTQPAAQAMLYGIGLTDEDMKKAQVGIASMGYDGNTCNMHLNDLAQYVKKGVWQNELVGLVFNTIGVSDGMSNGTAGMHYSLVSRDVIADSIETICGAQYYDGIIGIPGCDKNMPGTLMAMGRLNRPSIMVYGGTIAPGCLHGEELNIISAFEALGQKIKGTITDDEYTEIIKHSCPGPGACGGMYTANTMASIAEALGMSLPYSSSNPAISEAKRDECIDAGRAIKVLLEKNILPRDIMTREAFENAIVVTVVLGGSTNAVMHLIAIAKSVGIELTLQDFQNVSDRVPMLGNFKPSGKYMMQALFNIGGLPRLLKYLLNKGLINGDCLTCTGKTMAENLADIEALDFESQDIITPIEKPIKETGHLQMLFGNIATEGSVAKITGHEGVYFKGPAKIFDGEEKLVASIADGGVQAGDVVVIKNVGPAGGPGMPEMLKPTSAIMGAGLGNSVAMITDGRFSGGSHGFLVGHITPEAYKGGNIGLIEEGDIIEIDAVKNTIDVLISDEILAERRKNWVQPELKFKKGVLYKYSKTVASASKGCVTDEF